MNLSQDAIQEIAKMAEDRLDLEFVSIPGDQSGARYWRMRDGSLKRYDPEPHPRCHRMAGPSELKAFILRHVAGVAENYPDAGVFVSEDRIQFVWDMKSGREWVDCKLNKSAVYRLLERCANKPFTQKELIRTLRVDLATAMKLQPELLLAVRNLKISSHSDGSSNVGHGDESLGKSIRRNVSGAQAIPETVVVDVSVFDQFVSPFPVTCAVEIDVEEGTISLIPIDDQLRKVMDFTIQNLVGDLLVLGVAAHAGQFAAKSI